jgi:multidrug efflux system membrane fusion protein
MKKRTLVGGLATALVVGVAAFKLGYWQPESVQALLSYWQPQETAAKAPRAAAPRSIPIDIATATLKKVPVRVDLLGTVTPIANVAVKTRIDSEITGVHFKDGAMVRKGDLLFTLDGRALEAQIRQIEGQLARDRASLEGAERDVRRYTELVAKSATPVTNLDNAKTQVGVFTGATQADEASIENLKVQLSYATIRAPITGRASMAAVKVGNFVRQADVLPIATIIQTAPVYVTFALPQRSLPELRHALDNETASIQAVIPGDPRAASGQVTMIENTVDATTGMVLVRAIMNNTDEALWPGSLVNTVLTVRSEEEVAVPAVAVQTSQTGTYVFVIKDGVAKMQPVTVERTSGAEAAIAKGLDGGETVVIDGQMLLSDGTKVSARAPKVGS